MEASWCNEALDCAAVQRLLVLKFISSLVRSARSLFRALFTIHVDLVKKSVKNMFNS